jgi:type IV pilus biogenesis protein CpaD/CtpE
MRFIICVVVAVALVGLTGCAKNEPAQVDQPADQTETEPISAEDFESGEVENVVDSDSIEPEATPADSDH